MGKTEIFAMLIGLIAVSAMATTQDDMIVFNSGNWAGSYSVSGGFNGPTAPADTSLAGFGLPAATAMVGDINGDGIDDMVVAQDNGGIWQWVAAHSTDLDFDGNGVMSQTTTSSASYGNVSSSVGNRLADITGDGIQDIVTINSGFLWNTYTSTASGIGTGAAQTQKQFGLAGDHAISGDFNGDGMDDIGVWRNGGTFVKLTGGTVGSGVIGTGAQVNGSFGSSSWDITLVGDINGDGRDDLVLVDNNDSEAGSAGLLSWVAAYGQANGQLDWVAGHSSFAYFGLNTDVPLLADVNGDGMDDLVVSRGGTTSWESSFTVGGDLSGGAAESTANFGSTGDIPLFGQLNTTPVTFAIGSFTADDYSVDPGSPVTLSWETIGATALDIDQGVGDVFPISTDGDGSTNVSPTITTTYTLTASNAVESVTANLTINVNPAAPTGLVAVSSTGSVALAWSANLEGDLASYSVYRKEGEGSFAMIASVETPTTTYTDYGLTSGAVYTYQVTAVNAGGGESAASNPAVGSFSITIDLSPFGAKPNIIFVMSDDQGWGDTGYNGHPIIQTPEIDSMALDGYVFHRFYAAAPNCSPSRAAILTGRDPIRCKVSNHGRYMRAQEMTLAEALKDAGYVTGVFGKLHIGSGQPDSPANPTAMGFDEWVIGLNYFDNDPYLSRMGVVEHPTGKGTEITMDETISFLDAHKNGGNPMFALAWFPAPHRPYDERASTSGLYTNVTGTTAFGAISNYYDEVTLLDENLGRLRQWLRDNSIHENTILWFCSDNGGYKDGESMTGGREGKGTLYEGGLRVPSIIEWPARNLKGGIHVPIVHTDMYPTLLAMAGVSVENQLPLDGVDVRSIIENGTGSRGPIGFWDEFEVGDNTISDPILSAILVKQLAGDPVPHDADRIKKDMDEFPQLTVASPTGGDPWAAWLDWPWKLHRRYNTSSYELYNLETDPMETTDLLNVPEHAQRVIDMKAALWAWQESVVDSVNGADYAQLDTWLPMNRTEGVEAFDASGEQRGDLVNFADNTSHWVAGKHGRAIEFDGIDDEVDMGNDYFYPPVGANARTVSAWIKTTAGGRVCHWGDASFNGAAWDVVIDENGRLHLDVGTGFLTGTADLRDGQWHHIAIVLPNDGTPDVTEAILYVDGNAETPSASGASAVETSNSDIHLGARTNGTTVSIDEFRIVPVAWSAGDVLAAFNATNQASAAWLYEHGIADPVDWNSDLDNDGLNLLSEYALGTDPNVEDGEEAFLLSEYNATTKQLETTFTRRKEGTHDLDYAVSVTTNLVDDAWSLPVAVQSTMDHPSLDTGLFELQTVESDPSLTNEPTLFMRVKITQP